MVEDDLCVRDGLFQRSEGQIEVHFVSEFLHQVHGLSHSTLPQSELQRERERERERLR